MLDAYAKMNKCAKGCVDAEYKKALEALNTKYKDKFDKLMKEKLSNDKLAKLLVNLTSSKLEEMKNIQSITRYYACMISKCGHEVEQFRKSMAVELKNTIEDLKTKLKQQQNDPNAKKNIQTLLDTNKRRLALVKTSLTIPKLITILNA